MSPIELFLGRPVKRSDILPDAPKGWFEDVTQFNTEESDKSVDNWLNEIKLRHDKAKQSIMEKKSKALSKVNANRKNTDIRIGDSVVWKNPRLSLRTSTKL